MIDSGTKDVMQNMVVSLLANKPSDPVPHIYSFLKEIQKGVDLKDVVAINENELNELQNLKKKTDYLKQCLNEKGGPASQTESEDDESDQEEEIQPRKKNIKKQRHGVSAEVYGEYNKKGDFKPKIIQKTQAQKDSLRATLLKGGAFMFQALDDKELDIVVDAIEIVEGKSGDFIIKEGDQGDCMYVLEKGALDCTKMFAGKSEPTFLKKYIPGESFGELALLYNAPRAATIKASEDYVVLRLDRDTFNHIVKDAAQMKREKYDNFLQSVDILKTMDPYERTKICDALVAKKFNAGEYVITEGEIGDTFYLLSEGTAVATKNLGGPEPQVVKEYERGQYFGERALLTNEARAANIRVTSDNCVVLALERATFNRLLGNLNDILRRNMDEYNKYVGSN